MTRYRIISADAHVLEPPHIWHKWLPSALQERAPQLTKDSEGGDGWLYDGLRHRHEVGVENIMWSTDYPHHGNDWPYSRKVIAETMAPLPAEERAAIVAGNAARIFGLRSSQPVLEGAS